MRDPVVCFFEVDNTCVEMFGILYQLLFPNLTTFTDLMCNSKNLETQTFPESSC